MSEGHPNVLNQIENVVYTARTHTTGGREGASKSSDGRLSVTLSIPGGAGSGTNPEQLFAAGWSGCFLSSLAKAARASGVRLPEAAAVDAEIDLGSAGPSFFLAARLKVSLPGMDRAAATAIVKLAHQNCPYSKATRHNIDVEITVV